ncbi:hypothetical protein [Taibaiella soli]|uniref:Uncharacterized protein n=1 Tax=Taibaiella soli TaxID=1649169 RepID=A0A2W2AML8_9BACT|nr:hypothetical protein [Taibaiella soli]PZF73560.1 hypothetical protein DN068_07500 [Taibaiella soli]
MEPTTDMRNFPNPDYVEIKKYLNDRVVNEIYFKKNFSLFVQKDKYIRFREFLEDEQLASDANLYFLGLYYFDALDSAKWSTSIEYYKIPNNYNQDLKGLKSFFKELKSAYENPKKNTNDEDYLQSLTFKSNRKTVSVKTHPLLFDIFFELSDWVENQPETIVPKEKNVAAYYRDFIKRTRPLFNYLRHTHYAKETDQTIYSLVANFVDALGFNWEDKDEIVKSEYIRKAYN